MHRDWPEVEPDDQRPVLIAFDRLPGLRPQIYIGVKYAEDLVDCLELFESLAAGETANVDLADPDLVRMEGLHSLVLLRVERKGYVSIRSNAGLTTGEWACSPDEWRDNVDFLRTLLDHGGPAHQYLRPDGLANDAEIEFDYGGLHSEVARV